MNARLVEMTKRVAIGLLIVAIFAVGLLIIPIVGMNSSQWEKVFRVAKNVSAYFTLGVLMISFFAIMLMGALHGRNGRIRRHDP